MDPALRRKIEAEAMAGGEGDGGRGDEHFEGKKGDIGEITVTKRTVDLDSDGEGEEFEVD